MGEIADMMIEAMENGGWVGDVRIDPETGEVLEVNDEPRKRRRRKPSRAR